LPIFRDGYESVADWPEREPGEVATFLAGRALVLANSVLIAPEYAAEAPGILAAFEERLRELAERDPISK
jgi:hypothetical protein